MPPPAVRGNQRQRQSTLVAVVKMQRLPAHRVCSSCYFLLRRQSVSCQPRLALFTTALRLSSLQPVQHRPQRRKAVSPAVSLPFLLQLLRRWWWCALACSAAPFRCASGVKLPDRTPFVSASALPGWSRPSSPSCGPMSLPPFSPALYTSQDCARFHICYLPGNVAVVAITVLSACVSPCVRTYVPDGAAGCRIRTGASARRSSLMTFRDASSFPSAACICS